jgi:hypothetical protein
VPVHECTCASCGAQHRVSGELPGSGIASELGLVCRGCGEVIDLRGRAAQRRTATEELGAVEALERLAKLRESGGLSDEEYAAMKARIIQGERGSA